MTRDELLKIVRECEDHLVEVMKVLSIFDADENWHKKYNDDTRSRIDQFNHLDLDPRIIAYRGNESARQIKDKLRDTWYGLMEDLREEKKNGAPTTP